MSLNLAKLTGGPAIITFNGASIYTKDGVKVDAGLDTFNIGVEGVSAKADERVKDQPLKASFTPAGVWGNLAALFPYFGQRLGSLITPVVPVSAINLTTNVLTATGHGRATGDAVLFATTGTAPIGLDQTTTYYVRAVSADTVTLHDTAAHAAANSNVVDISADGSGSEVLVANQPLTIWTFAGVEVKFHNAAVVKHSDLDFSAEKTLFGSATEFEIFLRQGKTHADANSLYTITAKPFTDTSFTDVANIITQPYMLSWGEVTPWDAFETKAGVRVSFPLTLDAVMDDTYGTISRRLTDVQASATLTALGMTETDLLAALKIQDTGAVRGRSLNANSANLDITGTGVFCRINAASPKKTPLNYNTKDERSGEIEFVGTRTFTAGVADPIAVVGTAAP